MDSLPDKSDVESRLTERDREAILKRLGFDFSDSREGKSGWTQNVYGPPELGEGEKPNFAVQLNAGAIRDHGSGPNGYSGDLWDAVESVNRCGFREAIEFVCKQAGIEMEKTRAEETDWSPFEGEEVERYPYRDGDGTLLYHRVRFRPPEGIDNPDRPKKFLPNTPGESGWGRGPDPVLYRLPEVQREAEKGEDGAVFVVEGEKDVHALESAEGFPYVATTSGSAGSWRDRFAENLEGANVVVIPDNDSDGMDYAESVAESCHPVAESVRIIELDDVPAGGDVSDWLGWGHTAEELLEEVAETEEWTPADSLTSDVSGDGQASGTPELDTSGTDSSPPSGERYVQENGRMVHVKPKSRGGESRNVVADFVARITREITMEDGARAYRIEGETKKGRPFALDIEASEFERDRSLKSALGAAAGAESAVRAGMTRHIAPALKMLSSDVEKRKRYKRTGWTDSGFVLPGRTGEDVEVSLPDSLPYRANADADIGDGRDALDNLLQSIGPDKTAPVLSFMLTGPVVRHVQQIKRHGMFIKGRTGSLKTSVSQALMCIYGAGFIQDENLLKMGEGMTRNAAMALAGASHDLPIFFDNYKPSTGRGDRDFINLIHNVIEGGEKARLNRNSELKERRNIRAWPLITGEDLPNTDPASLARVLSVEFKWNSGEDNPELTRAQENHDALPAIGREWIEWLHTSDGQEALSELEDTFPDRRKKWTAYLRRNRPDMVNILRVASNLATNTLVYDAAKQCPAMRSVLAEHEAEYRKGLKEVAYRMGDYTCESLEARRLLDGIKSLQAAGRVNFAKRLGTDHYEDENRIGYWDEDGYYLILDLAIESVEDLYQRSGGLGGVTRQTLCSQLEDLDLVARNGRSRTTRTVRVGDGKRKRVLHLKSEALEEVEEGADQ